jgi:basic amino acid/polyamine antiporter, APA family
MNQMKRDIRTPGAILMGLGSIVGTGIFVSIAIATQVSGNGVILAIVIAAALAVFNGLSSAQLAAAHPVSGGTYEYGYRFAGRYYGFTAGWMFLLAKSASAATALLGCSSYLFYLFEVEASKTTLVLTSLALLLVMTLLVSGGIRRSNTANKVIVSVTLFGLAALILAGLFVKGVPTDPIVNMFDGTEATSVLYASALMFVAYTGYGRIATLGEEVAEPRKTIPRSIILAMIVIVFLYLSITLTSLNIMGAEAFGASVDGDAAPLMIVAQTLSTPYLGLIVSIAAITAMMGVLLNLILGLSRVMLSMGRRKDLPETLSRIHPKTGSPVPAVLTTGGVIALLTLSGDVFFTWSFSAFTVLIYYSITNLSALKLPEELRLYPKWIPVMGLAGCLFLAFWIELNIIILGLILIAIGLKFKFVLEYASRSRL